MKAKLLILSLDTAIAYAEPKQKFQSLYGKNGTLRDASGRTVLIKSNTT